jgi:hypothetical protein
MLDARPRSRTASPETRHRPIGLTPRLRLFALLALMVPMFAGPPVMSRQA